MPEEEPFSDNYLWLLDKHLGGKCQGTNVHNLEVSWKTGETKKDSSTTSRSQNFAIQEAFIVNIRKFKKFTSKGWIKRWHLLLICI